jgi:ATP-binding cassette subfamily F protein 3
LAKILLDPPNLILMDEPTTHLDISSVEVLIEALKKFTGTFCFISHDVYFIKELADHILHVNAGKITLYPGNYDYFLHKKSLEESEEGELFRSEEKIEASTHQAKSSQPKPAEGSSENKPQRGPKTKEQKRKEAEERNARYKKEKEGGNSSSGPNEEQQILEELGRPETHQNPERVKELTIRLSLLKKRS